MQANLITYSNQAELLAHLFLAICQLFSTLLGWPYSRFVAIYIYASEALHQEFATLGSLYIVRKLLQKHFFWGCYHGSKDIVWWCCLTDLIYFCTQFFEYMPQPITLKHGHHPYSMSVCTIPKTQKLWIHSLTNPAGRCRLQAGYFPIVEFSFYVIQFNFKFLNCIIYYVLSGWYQYITGFVAKRMDPIKSFLHVINWPNAIPL